MRGLLSLATLSVAVYVTGAKAETTECTEITSLPTIITAQGVYCLKGNLSTGITVGTAIVIATNNVTIDLNGFKLGGLAAGDSTEVEGILALNRANVTIRNGSIRGFATGVSLEGSSSSGHVLENLLLDGNRSIGIFVSGTGMKVVGNSVVNTGGSSVDDAARGIELATVSNSVVADNVVSKTSETGTVYGIYARSSSKMVEIRNNSVFETVDGGANRGIRVSGSTNITVIDNRVINEVGTGDTGISTTGTVSGINCIDNVVEGFTTDIFGCDYTSGNHTPSNP